MIQHVGYIKHRFQHPFKPARQREIGSVVSGLKGGLDETLEKLEAELLKIEAIEADLLELRICLHACVSSRTLFWMVWTLAMAPRLSIKARILSSQSGTEHA